VCIKQLAVSILLAGAVAGLQAAPTDRYEEVTGEFDDFDGEVKEWKESLSEIPPLPGDGDWQNIQVDALPKNQHAYLDMKTLTISDKDFVVRYWLLIRSSAGAFTMTYEGLRCSTGEYIVYAYANPGRKPVMRKVKMPKWKKYGLLKQSGYRVELAEDFFCTGEIPRQKRQIEQAGKGLFEEHNPFDNWTNDD
jgi:hypothetical protein